MQLRVDNIGECVAWCMNVSQSTEKWFDMGRYMDLIEVRIEYLNLEGTAEGR